MPALSNTSVLDSTVLGLVFSGYSFSSDPFRPTIVFTENFERNRNGASSELQGRPPDPQHSTSDVAAQPEAQTPSYSEQSGSLRNEEEREFSVPVDVYKQQTGNGFEYPGVAELSQSKVPRRKEKIHGFQSKDLEGSGVVHGKYKRGPGKEKGHGRAGILAQDGSQVSCSSTAHSPQQSSVLASVYQPMHHPPRHSSTDATTAGTHFKSSQSRPYQNATGPGSFRQPPLVNYQFDPGTARMTAGSSGSSHSSGPQYPYYAPPVQFPPGFLHPSMYSPGVNIHKRNSPAKGDGNSAANAKNRMDHETIGSVEVPIENSADSPSIKSQSKVSEQVKQQFVHMTSLLTFSKNLLSLLLTCCTSVFHLDTLPAQML